jgi:peptide deformylase
MILELTPNTHPILHEKVKPCSKDLDRREMSRILKENMMHYEGVGLSANQIGIGERVFIMMLNMETEETITCFNPRIIKRYDDNVWCEEGCLSFPDEIINVERPDRIVVKYEDEDGKDHKIKLSGMAARVFLHEFDHLEGIVFTQRQ